jgi:hypothetical protein
VSSVVIELMLKQIIDFAGVLSVELLKNAENDDLSKQNSASVFIADIYRTGTPNYWPDNK